MHLHFLSSVVWFPHINIVDKKQMGKTVYDYRAIFIGIFSGRTTCFAYVESHSHIHAQTHYRQQHTKELKTVYFPLLHFSKDMFLSFMTKRV